MCSRFSPVCWITVAILLTILLQHFIIHFQYEVVKGAEVTPRGDTSNEAQRCVGKRKQNERLNMSFIIEKKIPQLLISDWKFMIISISEMRIVFEEVGPYKLKGPTESSLKSAYSAAPQFQATMYIRLRLLYTSYRRAGLVLVCWITSSYPIDNPVATFHH